MTDLKNKYNTYIKSHNLKFSKQRDFIFNHIIQTEKHFTIDSIYQEILKLAPEIGIATIYRTVRLLIDCEILNENTFGEKKGFFEVNHEKKPHHDHLICTSCGRIIEFTSNEIEEIQDIIASQNKFKIESHKLEIFGKCSNCK